MSSEAMLAGLRWSPGELPSRGTADVVVAGGGIAGVAAALAAARNGASVILLEKEISLGGLATLGVVLVYLPLCDGDGRQLIGGIGEELLKLAVSANGRSVPALNPDATSVPACWVGPASRDERRKRRYLAELNPASFILLLEEAVLRAGIDLRYDTRCAGVAMEGGRVTHVIAADKGGLCSYAGRMLVDATGDADLCMWAGERIVSCAGNVRSAWFYHTSGGALRLERLTEPFAQDPDSVPEGSMGVACRNARDVTTHVVETRKLLRQRLREIEARSGGAEVYPILLPAVPCFRMTRRLQGRAEPTAAQSASPAPDRIGITGDWRTAQAVHYLPLGSLWGRTPNLLTAGRSVSVANDLWDVTRVIGPCALTGEAAGTAAALACRAGTELSGLDVTSVQERLRERGAILEI